MIPEISYDDLDYYDLPPFVAGDEVKKLIRKYSFPILMHYYRFFRESKINWQEFLLIANRILLMTTLWRIKSEKFLIPTLTSWLDLLEKGIDVFDFFLIGWHTGSCIEYLQSLEAETALAFSKRTSKTNGEITINPKCREVYKKMQKGEGEKIKLSETLKSVFNLVGDTDATLNDKIAKTRSYYHRQKPLIEQEEMAQQQGMFFDFLLRKYVLGLFGEGNRHKCCMVSADLVSHKPRSLFDEFRKESFNYIQTLNGIIKYLNTGKGIGKRKFIITRKFFDVEISGLLLKMLDDVAKEQSHDTSYIKNKLKSSFITKKEKRCHLVTHFLTCHSKRKFKIPYKILPKHQLQNCSIIGQRHRH